MWQAANRDLKLFAECCYHVSGRETAALAADCGLSVDAIEGYRLAYALKIELDGIRAGSEVWEKSNISLWVKAARMRRSLGMDLEKIAEYLEVAANEQMTREQFAAHVDEKENRIPRWARRLNTIWKSLQKMNDDYKSEMPPPIRERYERAVKAFAEELEAIMSVDSLQMP